MLGTVVGPEADLGADVFDDLQEGNTALWSAQEDQAAAQSCQILLKRLQAMHEPPARAAAWLELTLLLRCPHK